MQRDASTCWAFSAVGAVEGTYNVEQRTRNANIDLSEQNLVSDCCPAGTCSGGWPSMALYHIELCGIVDEVCFPYQAQDSPCDECQDWENRLWKIQTFEKVPNSIEEIKNALISHGPLSVTSMNWRHAIVLVAYDDDCSVCRSKYGEDGCWIIRNSWGLRTGWSWPYEVWHENGYAYIPYSGHEYSDIRNSVYYVEGVISP